MLEASGVADPGSISMTFMDEGLRDRIRLDSVTCVVDADQVFAHQEYPGVGMLKLRQIGFADMVVLNKVDLAGPEQVQQARNGSTNTSIACRWWRPTTAMCRRRFCLSVGRFDPAQLEFDADVAVSSASTATIPVH